MRSYTSVSRISATLALILILGACASQDLEKREYITSKKVQSPPRTRTLTVAEASKDLRKSTKFITLSQNIRFNVGSTELSPSSRRALEEIASEIKKTANSFEKIRIEGLSDPTGNIQNNQRLSQARADRVRSYLISHGVPEDKLEAIGKGPVNSDSIASAVQNARDRRVDFEIIE
ncbi:OmpA family protein [uncultured Bdellovibrio sp.]|uniref:OmpA family protein n=1 Tax=Bdellovibrio sp. HCB-162 TaxID=3394234 RepID=UPI0025F09AF4|nr:OmpA family protein [uncultured Bdellovibrio sp.]